MLLNCSWHTSTNSESTNPRIFSLFLLSFKGAAKCLYFFEKINSFSSSVPKDKWYPKIWSPWTNGPHPIRFRYFWIPTACPPRDHVFMGTIWVWNQMCHSRFSNIFYLNIKVLSCFRWKQEKFHEKKLWIRRIRFRENMSWTCYMNNRFRRKIRIFFFRKNIWWVA